MRAHMKKHHIEGNLNRGLEERSMSADEMMENIRGSLPEWAVMLKGYRIREGLTQATVGEILGIEQTNISKMELGKRPIGKNLAKKLAKLFKTDYHNFL